MTAVPPPPAPAADDAHDGTPAPAAPAAPHDDRATGLPGLRSWPRVYWFVAATFVVYVVLLVALSRAFS